MCYAKDPTSSILKTYASFDEEKENVRYVQSLLIDRVFHKHAKTPGHVVDFSVIDL